ncbi:hypothetical protein KIN20_022892 [Parelaphostrongylus tenuis]|uniref:ShKT domain-containing protein n=1 Tax=Parelaphostrongylus tenuis TaxID=148309 RepID=A0AAD5MQU3_PARTN|nr:hypothetical protein KIN20_022892 [Parelaphostrongylus tenuis]
MISLNILTSSALVMVATIAENVKVEDDSSALASSMSANITCHKVQMLDESAKETCFNENECCSIWAERGDCTTKAFYMSYACKASCGLCTPQYPLADDCSDRHENCKPWAECGECIVNPVWMFENCRKSCEKCGQTRAQSCSEGIHRDDGDLSVREVKSDFE